MSGRESDQTRPISPSGASALTIDQPWRGSRATSVRHTDSARVSWVLTATSQPRAAPPMGFERRARERLVVVVPFVADVVDRAPRDLADLVGLGPQCAAHRVAEVDDRNDAVRISVYARGSREDADELVDAGGQANLFRDLAQDRRFGHLVAVDPTGDESPFVVVGSAHEKHAVVLVEERGVDTDLGGDVSQISGEARPHLGSGEAGAVGVLARRDREQLLVALAVERIGGVVKTGLRDGANLVEQRDDVDALEANRGVATSDAAEPPLRGESDNS